MTTQKTETLYYCRTCGRRNFVRKGPHRNTTTNLMCEADMVALKPQSCFNCNWMSKRACPPQVTVATREPWLGCTSWSPLPASTSLVPSVPSVPAHAPTLNDGHDQATAKELLKRFQDAQTGLRRVVAFGLFAWELKEKKLKHGQFGAWLAAHCPQLATNDSVTGKPRPSRALSGHMNLTKNVLDSIGFTVEKYLNHVSNVQTMHICHDGKYLLLPDKKLSPEALELKGKICNLVDGKTAKQLFFEFKQAEVDEAGNARPKVGRLKGHGGASKLQRAAKAAADAKAEKLALELAARDFCRWIKTNCTDDKIGTLLSDADLQAFNDWCKVGFDYSAKILSARIKAR